MDISEKIKDLMSKKDITAYRLAKDTNIPYTTLNKILNGKTKNPQIDSLSLIADYLNTTVDELRGKSEVETPEWADETDKNDLSDLLLKEEEVTYNGVVLTDEDKKSVNDMLTGLFWKRLEEKRRK
ncbi:helix-turn-helix transcriptional regulator [Paenibacillus ottowii]|uniref:helix-turn-helix domain-containing protein n=1 Tax=Paenibacillus TaxID=44249 RepID=UPI000737BD6A|nr:MULTISPECIES: helix-turn-helix transcriptional regulator [Paenibacillus]MDP1513117.1 helix-turn-helix transcriptional regulator [Paenibacillus ottowii]